MSSTHHYLTMSNGTGGTVRPASGWRKSGASISINATPANGYSFSGWNWHWQRFLLWSEQSGFDYNGRTYYGDRHFHA
jgi:Divergent InlB B-repeat domain